MANNILYSIGGSSGSTSIIDKYPPNPVTNLVAEPGNSRILLTWTEPEDLELVDGTVIKWAYTRIVRKAGSAPADINDGTIVINNSVKNQYQTEAYIDDMVENGTCYFYIAFAVSETGGVNNEGPSASATPMQYKTMTVVINESDSNPHTCCSYANDAVFMTSGKDATEWTDFFGYKPCLLKDGSVVGYLNPNDYTKFENGDPADITSGNAGDVMVEFPRRGVKISKAGNIITVSMTENPDDPEFTYYAHTRGSTKKDYFYISAYYGTLGDNNKMASVSGASPLVCDNFSFDLSERELAKTQLNDFLNRVESKGSGYTSITFYQVVFIQVMSLLQFKTLNISDPDILGYPLDTSVYDKMITGLTDSFGLNYARTTNTATTDGKKYTKLFGIENYFGGGPVIVNGIYYDATSHVIRIKSSNNDFNLFDGNDYDIVFNCPIENYAFHESKFPSVYSDYYWGCLSAVSGTSETGFLPSKIGSTGSSTTTYYCAANYIYPDFPTMWIGGAYMYTSNMFLQVFGNYNNEFVMRFSYY